MRKKTRISLRKAGRLLALLAFCVAPYPLLAAGIVEGVVRFSDDFPETETIRITKDLDVCGTKKIDETFVVSSETKGLRNAIITLVGASGDAPPAGTAEIEQKECRYGPHVQVVRPGTELHLKNEDDTLHNVHAFLGNKTLFNLAQPKYRKVIKNTLDEAGLVHLKCDVHDWMEAWILVTDEPFVAVTDENGRYRLEDVPPGTYTLRMWHEALGTAEKQVVVTEGGSAEGNFEIGE